jgi:anti-sigma-K factor RskA
VDENKSEVAAWAYVVVRLPAEKRRALVERIEGELAGLEAEIVAQWRAERP